ncbi:MAG: DUF2284 domain-containing protein [Synergistaceae bacterium]|nr:DUF2284 domain-containing protein [Synergistaceae bacterium]
MIFRYECQALENETSVGDFVRGYVDVPRFLECCKACPNYGGKWSCPPYDFEPLDLWRGFSSIRLFGTKIILDGSMKGADYNAAEVGGFIRGALAKEKHKLMELVLRLEAEEKGSLGLAAGSCELCGICSRREGGRCRRPELMRYSIEALGGNVSAVAEELLGTEIKWIKNGGVPEYFVLVCGLLRR